MSETDSPLKLWARENIKDIASWLLGVDVISAEEENIELATETPPRVDLLFRVELENGRSCLFHLEFQGRRSRPDMPLRELNHLTRFVLKYGFPLIIESFVLYTEQYAGNKDTGHYQVERLDGTPAIGWNYTPIHLWRMPAEPVLDIDRSGIIPLMGLMKIHHPQTTLPKMVARIKAEPDESKREGLFIRLAALLSDKELLAMLERVLEFDDMPVTPYIQRFYEKGLKETSRKNILTVIEKRFAPLAQTHSFIEDQLLLIDEPEPLDELFNKALDAKTVEEFTAVLTAAISTAH